MIFVARIMCIFNQFMSKRSKRSEVEKYRFNHNVRQSKRNITGMMCRYKSRRSVRTRVCDTKTLSTSSTEGISSGEWTNKKRSTKWERRDTRNCAEGEQTNKDLRRIIIASRCIASFVALCILVWKAKLPPVVIPSNAISAVASFSATADFFTYVETY